MNEDDHREPLPPRLRREVQIEALPFVTTLDIGKVAVADHTELLQPGARAPRLGQQLGGFAKGGGGGLVGPEGTGKERQAPEGSDEGQDLVDRGECEPDPTPMRGIHGTIEGEKRG